MRFTTQTCHGCNVFSFNYHISGASLNNRANPWRSFPRMHDDVIKWKPFPRYWPFLKGIHRSPVNSPHKGQWRGTLIFSLICAWTNGWINNRDAGDLRHHRTHYDVTVMVHFPRMTETYSAITNYDSTTAAGSHRLVSNGVPLSVFAQWLILPCGVTSKRVMFVFRIAQ